MSDETCPYWNRPLMRIDHYGEVLVGCVYCNRWGRPGTTRGASWKCWEDELEALRASVRRTTEIASGPGLRAGEQTTALGS